MLSRPRFGRGAVDPIALCGLAAASVAVLPAIIGAAKAESVTPQVFRVNDALPGKTPAQTPVPGRSFRDCSNGCPEMVVAPQGRFTMGAPAGEEPESLPDPYRGHSAPQHSVAIRHKFAIGKFDVTRDEYAQFVAETNRPDPASCITLNASGAFIAMNGNWHSPGFPQTGRDPVVCVGWDDAQAYASWLSAKTGHVYRLPTEAEWEYAARAGTTTPRYGKLDDIAWYWQNSNFSTHPVGTKKPNAFGLYDMLGNVVEWTYS